MAGAFFATQNTANARGLSRESSYLCWILCEAVRRNCHGGWVREAVKMAS